MYQNDEYYNYQFYLQSSTNTLYSDGKTGTIGADISINDAWDITFGNDQVIVAVIDDGVPELHDDLPLSRQLRLPEVIWLLQKAVHPMYN